MERVICSEVTESYWTNLGKKRRKNIEDPSVSLSCHGSVCQWKSKDHAGSLTNRTDIAAVGCHFLLCHLFCFVDKEDFSYPFMRFLSIPYHFLSFCVCVWSCDKISENFPAKTKKRRIPRSELISPDITKYVPILCPIQFNHHIFQAHCKQKQK